MKELLNRTFALSHALKSICNLSHNGLGTQAHTVSLADNSKRLTMFYNNKARTGPRSAARF